MISLPLDEILECVACDGDKLIEDGVVSLLTFGSKISKGSSSLFSLDLGVGCKLGSESVGASFADEEVVVDKTGLDTDTTCGVLL